MGIRSVVGRADLLRALVISHGPDVKSLDAQTAERFGRLLCMQFGDDKAPVEDERTTVVVEPPDDAPEPEIPVDTEPDEGAPQLRARLQARLFALLEAHALEGRQEPGADGDLRPLTAADCAPRLTGEAPHLPLVARPRLWPALRRSLACPRPAQIDVAMLVRRLARGETVRRLPRRMSRNWGGELVVVMQFADRLLPYEDDYDSILREVQRLHGDGGLKVWTVDDSPFEPCTVQRGLQVLRSVPRDIPVPPPGTPVLILGDLGLLSGSSIVEDEWREFCRTLEEGGARPVAWLPLSARRVSSEMSRHGRMYCLGADSDLRPVRPSRGRRGGLVDDLRETLLACMACCVRVEPKLLRALRRLHPATAAEPGLEALVWSHSPVVVAGTQVCEIDRAHVVRYRKEFEALPAAIQIEVLLCILHHHAWTGRSTECAEILIWQAHARPEARQAVSPEILQEASRWFRRMGRFPYQGPGDPVSFSRDLLTRHQTDATWIATQSRLLAPLWALSGAETVPYGFNPADIAAARRSRSLQTEAQPLALVQHNDRLYLRPDRGDQSRWPVVSSGGGVGWSERRERIGRWLEFHGAAVELPRSGDPGLSEFWLTADKGLFRFGALSRPLWAQEFGRDIHGLYADADIAGATQRFRYIEPGEFVMGSPDTEPERFDDEGPQHRVCLTEGFWLAETACSQAVWGAVMGSNPSQFKGDPLKPVERVSWGDVSEFLQKVGELLPGVKAELPTEAEWEYACRAGTETAFSWGDGITLAQANYDGRKAYAEGPTGEYRKKTVRVKSFAPNAWGLYQMHGNVWEWCAEGMRPYDGEAQESPRGEAGDSEDAPRVVRGGSWFDGPWRLRAAYRRQGPQDGRNDGLGFRVSLRFMSSAEGSLCLPGAAVAPDAGDEPVASPATISEKLKSTVRKFLGFDSANDTPNKK
ncbi:formylglycine-generating enzyme family protein [Zoogloea sp.]|uniref:formylglycine-generating enzyme family protein n=1 Tax=Zoogloea sp. TaxID=49181 RepID=UPI0026363FF4|nr:formylglycine-generating enzyme family protein [Zoogloea sp.]